MAIFSINNIKLGAISAIVPQTIHKNMDIDSLTEEEKKVLISTTGIETRRIAESNVTAADLCIAASKKVLDDLSIDRKEIDVLIFVSQTPDYTIPGSSMFIQQQLGLPMDCISIDINQGCAGYVYGLSVISSMMSSGHLRKGLLLVGDTITKTISNNDRSLVPIFSDAGSCTLLEFSNHAGPMHFNLQTDGTGYDKIIVKGSGARIPIDHSNGYLYMNGQDIFNFGLKEVGPNIEALLLAKHIDKDKIDYFVMHQANMLLNETIRKKSKIPQEKTLYSLKDYGNTSCATIPVTISAHSAHINKNTNLLLTGFGVGLSWGSVFLQTNDLRCLQIDEYRK